MKKPKISVIIPIYNVGTYLEETLNCLLNQSFIDYMEILMIDDGSSDDSNRIMNEFAEKHKNFYAFTKANEGPGIARNYGMQLAKGEYIQFLDADDYIHPDGYEKLYDMAKRNDSDIVTSFSLRLKRYNIRDISLLKKAYANINEDIDNLRLEDNPEILWDTVVWNKLFKKEFIDKNSLMFIPERILYEDGPFALKAYALADTISVSRDTFYYWRLRDGKNPSITQKYSNIENFRDRLKIIDIYFDILEEERFNDVLKEELYFKLLENDLYIHLRSFYHYDDEFYGELIRWVKRILDGIPQKVKNRTNSLKGILYQLVESEDIDGLCSFSRMYTNLIQNQEDPENIKRNFQHHIDFKKDIANEELMITVKEVSHDDANIFIKFSEKINYFDIDLAHKTYAKLIDKNDNEFPLKLNDIDEITVPINLICDKEHANIKIQQAYDGFRKEAYLKNLKRDVIRFDDFDVELGIEMNNLLSVNIRPTNDLDIIINDIKFKDDSLHFSGISDEKVTAFYMENVISFNRREYPVESQKGKISYEIHPVLSSSYLDSIGYDNVMCNLVSQEISSRIVDSLSRNRSFDTTDEKFIHKVLKAVSRDLSSDYFADNSIYDKVMSDFVAYEINSLIAKSVIKNQSFDACDDIFISKVLRTTSKDLKFSSLEEMLNIEKSLELEPTIKEKTGYVIRFSIPYRDILSFPVRKWELKASSRFKDIRLVEKFNHYLPHHLIYVRNIRHKLLISDDFR